MVDLSLQAGKSSVQMIDPTSQVPLVRNGTVLVRADTSETIVPIVRGIPRFVTSDQNYAESFGYQWNKWRDVRSDSRSEGEGLCQVLAERTHFDEYDMTGKTILECGAGGGDDTEILLTWPFSEIHSFDISTAIERAADTLKDPRLTLSQASILAIPYPDLSFDVVFCHRVLQHTPDPEAALRCVCRKVKPGGLLFAHIYRRSWGQMTEWRYKYRWLTKRLPWSWIVWYVDAFGNLLDRIGWAMERRGRILRFLRHNFLPFYLYGGSFSRAHRVELEKQITFDALTPRHDHPMTAKRFRSIIESEGFSVQHFKAYDPSPVICTAIRNATG
jgi:SAM-dependent methyltransferase